MNQKLLLNVNENVHYEIVPADDEHGWNIRILEEYPETVISFGAIEFNGEEGDDGHLSFNFTIISSPDGDLSVEDLTFQEYVGKILSSVIETSISEGTMIASDTKTGETLMTEQMSEELYDEYKSGTDDTEEPTDQ